MKMIFLRKRFHGDLFCFAFFFYSLVVYLLVSVQNLFASSPFIQSIADQELFLHGKAAYEKRCAGCHGANGDGKGETANMLDPKPRDFTKGIFKFRSSPLGTLPSDQDLMMTLSKGILGTSMPSFSDVPERERYAIVHYIKSFSPLWKEPTAFASAVTGAPFPQEDFQKATLFLKRAEKGRVLFIEACVTCHGQNGQGDGAGGVDLVTEWNESIKPANLTKPYIKSGSSVRDIYLRLLTGVGGTPMPAFKDAYTDDQLWDLAAWILYLRGVYQGSYDLQKLPLPLIQNHEIQQ
jgi:cytochrome c oxidase cbb3-type subunit 2